ncbi:MAG: hypothetical protein EZS28_047335, partial [Streblomastix strix]
LYIERSKGHFPPFEERMSKDLIQQHRTAWNLEGYDLVDQKSRHSDPPPAGYAEGNVQVAIRAKKIAGISGSGLEVRNMSLLR